jgi:hypothetical protein
MVKLDRAQRFRSLLAKFVVVVAAAWIVFAVVCAALGIGVPDIGSNDNLFTVAVQNDTSETVALGQCSADCGSFSYTWTLRPHQSASTGQDPDGVLRPLEVLSSSHVILGCMPFRFSKTAPSGTVVQISQMVPCGNSVGAEASGEGDWPFSQY